MPALVWAGPPPVNPAVVLPPGQSSMTVTWGDPGGTNGFVIEASTSASFIPVVVSSDTLDTTATSLTLVGLSPNTTYYIQAGAIYAGSTFYASAISPNPLATAASYLSNFQLLQVTSTSIQMGWNAVSTNSAAGYLMDLSTSSNFSGPAFSSGTPDVALSTLTVVSLSPNTSYYIRVAAINWNGVPSFSVLGSTMTGSGTGGPPLSPFVVAPPGVSTMTVSWTSPGATNGFVVETSTMASFIPLAAVSTTTNPGATSLGLSGLTPNTTYFVRAGAIYGGTTSYANTSPSALSTLASALSGLQILQTSSTSVQARWNPVGATNATGYKLELSTSAGFIGTIISSATSSVAVSTLTVTALSPATTYYVRAAPFNWNNVPNFVIFGSTVTNPSSGGGAGTGGQGTASVAPANLSEGASVQSTTVTFIVPAGGFAQGGGVKVQLPFGWGPFLQNSSVSNSGYVTVLSNPSQSFVIAPSTSEASVTATLAASQSLAAGSTIQVVLAGLFTNCPPPGQPTVSWPVFSRSGSGASLSAIAAFPTQSVVVGSAKNLAFNPWSILTVVANQPSTAILLEGRSFCGNPAPLASSVTINLSGMLSNFTTVDANAQFSSVSNFATLITSVAIPVSGTQATFYYKTSSSGNNLSVQADYNDLQNGFATHINRIVNVAANAVTFSGLSIDDGSAASTGQTSFTLTPDNDGTNDVAYIRFVPSDTTANWHVVISSDGFNSFVYETFGTGNPQGNVRWDGRPMFGPASNGVVPNGTYQVKVEVPGLTPNTSLSITVSGASISGRVTLGGSGVPNAWVNAQATTGGSYGGAVTDGSGNYSINGLKSGKIYNLYTGFYDTTTQTPFNGSLANITAPATNANIVFSQPALLRVAATLSQPALQNLYGNVSAQDSSYTRFYGGSIRFLNGSTTSDNGDPFNSSTWTVLVVQPGSYNVQLNMPGFPFSQQSVTVSAGQTYDVPVFNLTLPSAVYGRITLPAPVTVGTWIPVEGVKSGNTFPTVWGGVYFNSGQSTGIYSVFNVTSGAYTFRVRAPGYTPVSISTTVAGSGIGDSTNGGLDVASSSFTTGGRISGTLTINGDTTGIGTTLFLYLNTYSSSYGPGQFTQINIPSDPVQVSTSYALGGLADGVYQVYPPYLNGFEVTPPGPKSVTVSGGVGTLNLTIQQNTGQLRGAITLPGSNTDYGNVVISMMGPNVTTTTVPSGANYALTNLGSGYFSIVAYYQTTGAQVRQSVSVVNGQITTLNLNFSAPTYSVSGTASVQTAFTVLASTGATVTINTITDLLTNANTQYITIGTTTVPISTARVEAFPKTFSSFGISNRTGFGNTFAAADFHYGLIQADGSYSITGLSPGVWEVSVYPYLDGGQTPGLAAAKQTLTITSANQTGINFALSGGYSVGGTVSLPGGLTDNPYFEARIVTERGDYVQSTQIPIGTAANPANSTTYLFKNLAPGHYVLLVIDPGTFDPITNRMVRKYVAKPVAFEIRGSNITNQDVTMAKASRITGSLSVRGKNADGTPSSTLITANNIGQLPDNFRIAAVATPWVEGGYQEADRQFGGTAGGGRPDIDADNKFHIEGVVAGTYDIQFRQDTFINTVITQGSLNLAAFTKGGVLVTEGQAVDLGTIELKQGLTLSGTVKDEQGNALPNVRVRASASGQHHDNSLETVTDAAGQYSINGINPDLKAYDIVAAPRPFPGDNTPSVPYGQKVKRAVDITQVPIPAVNFTLAAANASLTGSVSTSDNGSLSYPEGERQGYPAAAIYMHRSGENSADNPLGEIQEPTALDGSYSITNLVPGTYEIQIISLNYKPHKFTLTIAAGANSVAAVTLQKGAVLNATLAKSDGSGVNTDDVNFAVAVTADLSSIIFGQIASDDNTRTIRSVRFSGFETAKRYSVLFFDKRDNINSPVEGRNVQFAADTDEKTLTLTFQPTAPTAFAQVKKIGSAASVTLYFSRALRNKTPSDDDATTLVSVQSGAGALSAQTIDGDRRSMSFLYTPPASEQTATIVFSALTSDINPATGTEFPISKTITLRFGHDASAEKNINPVLGGQVTLAESDSDPTTVDVPSNALQTDDGETADPDASYSISLTKTSDLDTTTVSRALRVQALERQMALGPAAFLPEAYMAMRSVRASAAINPLSSFYSVLLPAGLSHTLSQTATLTLHYSDSADPNLINIYYFDGTKYLLEKNNRTIDSVNHTISVGVSHFSTFVVLETSDPVVLVTGDSSSAGHLEVMNFPNPFDLSHKTRDLTHGGSTSSLDTDGTIIRFTIPTQLTGAAHIDIYNVVGEKVRSIDLGVRATATYHYVTWDGKNDSGNKVASGVYIGVLKVGGEEKSWKMAVIK